MADKMFITLEVDDKGTAVIKKFDSNTQAAFDKVKKNASAGSEQAGKMQKAWSGAIDKIKSHWMGLTAVGVAAIYGISKAISAGLNSIKEWVGLANVQEAAEKNLGAVLMATGNAAGYNLAQLQQMASGMQAVTTVGDEVILSGMAILATFKQVRGEAFERSTKAALDMSQVMKQDLKSSMVMIGKAVNDPITGMSMLTRVGVTFTQQQKDMAKQLQESGDMVGAQNIILKELESQFGGAAAAARDVFGGAVISAKNALGDMKEELGFVITKNQFFIELVKMVEQQFIAWGEQIKNNRQYLGELAKEGVMDVVNSMSIAIETMRYFHKRWQGIQLVAALAINAIVIGLDGLLASLRFVLLPLDLIFQGLVLIGQVEINPFDQLQKASTDMIASSIIATASILADIKKTDEAYDSVIAKIDEWKKKIAEVPVTQAKATDKIKSDVGNTSDFIEAQKPKFQIDPVANTQLDEVKKKAQDTANAIDNLRPTLSIQSTTSSTTGGSTRSVPSPLAVDVPTLQAQFVSAQMFLEGLGATAGYLTKAIAAQNIRNIQDRIAERTEFDTRLTKITTPSFQVGTGPEGLPYTGLFHGHKGEIVKNPDESEAERRGKNGKTLIIEKIVIAPTFMTGDRLAGRKVAADVKRELDALGVRLG